MNESNKTRGWIKLYRSIQDNDVWSDKPFDKAHAWIDMLLMANHEERTIGLNGHSITVQPGTFITSMYKLADRWGWPKTSVKRFLNRIESETMIVQKAARKWTIISVVNWRSYQDARTEVGPKADQSRTDNGPQTDPNKNKELEKELFNPSLDHPAADPLPPDTDFDLFWKAYPKKVGKEAARKSWKKLKIGKALADQIIKAVEDNARNNPQWKRENGRFIPNPSTWLNQGRWEDEFKAEPVATSQTPQERPTPKQGQFSDYPQRPPGEKDYDALERQLLRKMMGE